MKEINKTTRYLFVPFAFQDKTFISNYNACHKGLKIYLDDTGIDDEYCNDCFYVYFDKTKIVKFEERLLFFRLSECYVRDYEISSTEHMIIFKYREEFKDSVIAFLSGWYHLMYDRKIIETYFSKHADYYIKYKDVSVTKENIHVLQNLSSLENHYKYIQVSPYHVLKNSKELRELLSLLYNVDEEILKSVGLDSKPVFSEEVFRWDSTKYEYKKE